MKPSRLLDIVLFLSLSATLLTTPSFVSAASGSKGDLQKDGYTMSLALSWNPKNHTPQRLREGDEAACLFKTEIPLRGISVQAPSYSNNFGDLTIKIFRWKGDPETTLSEKPLASETFVDFPDNSSLTLRAKLKPGTYLWIAGQAREQVGLWKSPESIPNVRAFFNGEELTDGAGNSVSCFRPRFRLPEPLKYERFASLPTTSPPEPEDRPELAEKT